MAIKKGAIKKLFTTSNASPSKGQRIAQGIGAAGAIGATILGTGLAIQGKQKIKSAIKKAVKAPKNIVDKVKENREFKKQQREITRQKQQEQTPKPTFTRRAGSKVPKANK